MQEGLERMKKLALLSRTRFRFANVHEQAVAPPLRRRRLWTTSACTTLCAGCPTSANHAPIGLPDRRNAPPSLPHHYVGFPNKRAAGARHPFDHGLHQALRGDSVQEHAPRAARHATAAMNPQRVHRNDAPEFTDLVGRDDLSEILAILAEAQQRAGLLSGATLGPGRAHRSARRRSSGQAPISLPRKGDTESIRTTDPDVPTDTSRGKTAIRRAEDLR
ncbi:hypothetical protein Mapa_015689 [Marchantia paleacea]|nr:hypothetical protein Mapa_015689 [Marchantia paleacea]